MRLFNNNKQGSAIIIVLIISIIAFSLTVFTIGISKKVVSSSEMLMDKLQAKFGVNSDIEKLKFYVSTGKFYSYYIENNHNTFGFPKKLYIDGRKQKIDNTTTLILQDTGGLLDVWVLDKKTISSLLSLDNISPSNRAIAIDSLEDWYDKDNLRRLNGAESEYYQFKRYKYTPRNFNGVQSVYEWHIIRGLIDNKTFTDIAKYLTISPNWHVNIDTMNAPMLSATLGISLDTANSLLNIKRYKGKLSLSDIKEFVSGNINTSNYSDFPTFVLDINAKFKFNVSMEDVSCTISFIPDNSTPYRVLRWQN